MSFPSSGALAERNSMLRILWLVGAGLLLLPFLTAASTPARGQASPSATATDGTATDRTDKERSDLELNKLRLEVEELDSARLWRFAELLTPITVAGVGWWVGHAVNKRSAQLKKGEDLRAEERSLEAGRFSALVEERASAYAKGFAILAPTALYFPGPHSPAPPGEPPSAGAEPDRPCDDTWQLTRTDCERMGRQLASQYFGEGGLFMSEETRGAYFALIECLRRASLAKEVLRIPPVGGHTELISYDLLRKYRETLAKKSKRAG